MATCDSTSPAHPSINSPGIILAPQPEPDDIPTPLFVKSGDAYRRAPEALVINCAHRLVRAQFCPGGPVLSNPTLLQQFLTLKMGPLDHEVFAIILLDVQSRLIDYLELFRGSIDGAAVHTREIIKHVIARRATSVVLAHNHPSGNSEPSDADMMVTRRIKEALALFDIRLADHLVVGRYVASFAARGLL